MNHAPHPLRATARAIALLAVAASAHAQTQSPTPTGTLAPVTVTGQAFPPAADVTGFGDYPLKDVPVSANVIDSRAIAASGARRLADLTRFDASVADAYNAPGYWDFLSIRGYVLDNRFNYRREGLPINAETTIPLDNKARVEILKGTSGIQAGTSAPGGLVNYVVKRPTDTDLRQVELEWTQRASLYAAADLGGRAGNDGAFGYRINVAGEQLRPLVHNLDGHRSLFAFAGDWRLPHGALLEGEFEWSRKVQASQTGFSLLGTTLPAVPDPRTNLNNQPWAQPSKFDALTGTLRWTQPLANDWRFVAQAGTQHLKNDDFTAFPFGCSAENNFSSFCSDGTFDYYDFRSIGERRREDALAADIKGKLATGAVSHDLSFGVLRSTVRNRLPDYAYNFVGTGDITGTQVVPPDPTPVFAGTRLDEHSTELHAQDAAHWTSRITTWLGVRHTRIDRSSVATDGSGATSYSQSLTTPWIAASYKLNDDAMVYASWGEGVESAVVPNNADVYANPGAVLPALKSKQTEVGFKGAREGWSWQLDAFDIRRPVTNLDSCSGPDCVGALDGTAHHRGLEGTLNWSAGAWRAGATAMLLRARREGSADPTINGLRPQNVPNFIARAYAAWRVPGVQGAELQGSVLHEGNRAVLADNSVMLPAWTRLDVALKYETQLRGVTTTWLLGVDNVTDRRYWRESPFQFGHVYLYPGAPRTARLTFIATM